MNITERKASSVLFRKNFSICHITKAIQYYQDIDDNKYSSTNSHITNLIQCISYKGKMSSNELYVLVYT